MQQDKINDQDIDVVVIGADGAELQDKLQPDERDWLSRIDAALQSDPQFKATYPAARLMRIDSNRGLTDRDEGRFYLRYQSSSGMAEFWGNVGDTVRVDVDQGIVVVAD